MTLIIVVSKIVEPQYIELNDFSTLRVPGKVILKTTSPVPVSELPGADLNQYGHEYANGSIHIHPKSARYLFGHDPVRGEQMTVEARINYRNRAMRKCGTFCFSPLRKE